MHLRNQVLDALVLLLAPETRDEVYVDVFPVDILVEIEDVHLENGLYATERRPIADARARALRRCP